MNLASVSFLLFGCTQKQVPLNVTVVSTVPYARHIAADLLQTAQMYDSFYWKEYRFGNELYTFVYGPFGERGNYADDILVMRYGERPGVDFLDQGIVGGISYIISSDGTRAAPFFMFPENVRAGVQEIYLDALLKVNTQFNSQKIKSLEEIIPP